MSGQNIELIITDDGSHSLYNSELNETYHSFHGAVQESRHVFIKMGLDFCKERNEESLNILEVGMGTGLNVLLSVEWAQNCKRHLDFTTVEAYPIDSEMVDNLNYAEYLGSPNAQAWLNKIHVSPWNKYAQFDDYFSLHKVLNKLEDVALEPEKYDVVFFDAFAPNKQEELWDKAILSNMYNCQAKGGVFVTYCAKGQLKRDLKEVGYQVETLPGPPGKKEMVRAQKN